MLIYILIALSVHQKMDGQHVEVSIGRAYKTYHECIEAKSRIKNPESFDTIYCQETEFEK